MRRTGNVISIPPGGALVTRQLIPASLRRQVLGISIDTGIGYVSDSAAATGAQGFVVTPEAPLWLDKITAGDLLHHAWYCAATLNTAQWGLIELEDSQ